MPLPRSVARLNKRFTNRFIEPVVRRYAGFTVVWHTGRQSGTTYRTPVYAFDCHGAWIIALTYGPGADWVQNVQAGGGRVQRAAQDWPIINAQVVDRDKVWACLPRIVRFTLRLLRVTDFMQIAV